MKKNTHFYPLFSFCNIVPFVLLYMLYLPFSSSAQTLDWVVQMGGSNNDQANSIAIDALGNIYTAGYFEGTVDFDPGVGTVNLTSAGEKDIFVQKMDSDGNFVWVAQMGGGSDDEVNFITTDALGNIYILGSFTGTADFDPGVDVVNLTSLGGVDVSVQKLDSDGNFVWVAHIGGASKDEGRSIATDALGNVYTIGIFAGTVDFDPGVGTVNLTSILGDPNAFVQKLDSDGDFEWAVQIAGSGDVSGRAITIDAAENVYISGSFVGTADFDPGASIVNLTSVGVRNAYVQKMDADGNFEWVVQMGGSKLAVGNSITTDVAGNVYTTGYFGQRVDFDPGVGTANLTVVGIQDAFVQKLDSDGNFEWVAQIGGKKGIERGLSVTTDAFGGVYTTGFFHGLVDFDPGVGFVDLISSSENNKGGRDGFVQKLDSDGNFEWVVQMGGAGYNSGNSITTDAFGNVYAAGFFEEVLEFDLGTGVVRLRAIGSSDVFIQKLNNPSSLPVELVFIDGVLSGSDVEVFWQTASEINNDFFEILYSTSGQPDTFEVLDVVSGNGNTSRLIDYSYIHRTPIPGHNYYQLRQVDYDGTYEYSSITHVIVTPPTTSKIHVYPNPMTHREITIRFDTFESLPLDIKLCDLSGRELWTEHLSAEPVSSEVKVSLPNQISAGMHILYVRRGLIIEVVKLMVK